MARVNSQDIYDIQEWILLSIDKLQEDYLAFGSYLPFREYVRTRTATQLSHKYTSRDVMVAFDDDRIRALIAFYVTEEETEH